MKRREFLFLGSPRSKVMDFSCEELYMRYVDSGIDGSEEIFFQRISEKFRGVRKIRFHEACWLKEESLKEGLDPLLRAFISRGGSIEYL